MCEIKEQHWMKLLHKNKIEDSTQFFKKWYMTHSLEWMEGFNEALEIFSFMIDET